MSDQDAVKPAEQAPEAHTNDYQPDIETVGRILALDHRQRMESDSASAGKSLKVEHSRRTPAPLSAQLPHFFDILASVVRHLQAQTAKTGNLSSPAEWLVDNYYLAEQALRGVTKDLPSSFERQLPRLRGGQLRVYDISAAILHWERNSPLDMVNAQRFIKAYQDELPLTMGEVWSLPIMLRVIILENLLAATARLTDLPEATSVEVASLLESLNLSDGQLTVENCIRNLRILANYDWKRFFENLSLVEHTLRQDPAGIYAGMDFETRDRYRKVVEDISDFGALGELEVAREAHRLANERGKQLSAAPAEIAQQSETKWDNFNSQPEMHVGYFLLGKGRAALEEVAGYRPRGWQRLERFIRGHPATFYLGTIAGVTLVFILIALVLAGLVNAPAAGFLLVGILSLIPALSIAVELVNWTAMQLFKPERLPRMDFKQGIPKECTTLVVIPALLSDTEEIDSLAAQLEQHYLRNPDPKLVFALVTDHLDATTEKLAEDAAIVKRAKLAIRALNEKYPQPGSEFFTGDRFFLLHRGRRWNPSEGVWMGWERKRGKLEELNRLIRWYQDLSVGSDHIDPAALFPEREGDLSVLEHVRYVITLDADTILPLNTAQELISTLAHPLNRARLQQTGSSCGEKVTSGYTILQPRTEINPASSNLSYFTRIYAGDTGIDLYSHAVSDVYQDLFGEGIYVGKGIYEVETFERSLKDCIPQNAILSHDLLEGIHGRTALETATVLIEDLSPNYVVYTRRMHRWIRGDWQLLPWLFSKRLSLISRWKILDNLRRSLVAPAVLLFITAGWLVLPGHPAFYTIAGALVLAVPVLTGLWNALYRRMKKQPVFQTETSLKNSFFRWLLALVFLPYEALLAVDAIIRTLVRIFITQQRLLRWTTSASAARSVGNSLVRDLWQRMVFSPVLALALLVTVILLLPAALPWAIPLILAWLVAPWVAIFISRPLPERVEELDEAQVMRLRRLARRTWFFFETFTTPEDHWLPPDHFQETPLGVAAHRTSPTNIGLALLSALGAYDLGYLEALGLSSQLTSTIDTLEKLERHRGHFLNWYDTLNLEPLQPRYVSTVDSGNLAASLLALRQGCLEILDKPVQRWQSFEGLVDSIRLLESAVTELDTPSLHSEIEDLTDFLEAAVDKIYSLKDQPSRWLGLISDLRGTGQRDVFSRSWSDLDRLIVVLVESNASMLDTESLRRLRNYNQVIRQQLNNIHRSITHLQPWLSSFRKIPALFEIDRITSEYAADWDAFAAALPDQLALSEIPEACRTGRLALARLAAAVKQHENTEAADALRWMDQLEAEIDSGLSRAEVLLDTFNNLSKRINALFLVMDFSFLFDSQRLIFHIGYNVQTSSLDMNYYDLLASEARIASLVAIAKGEVPQSHWLYLSRPFTRINGRHVLISWSATMFEYMMPRLLIRNVPRTMLGQTLEAVADQQINYAREKNVPWGISESGYYRFDTNQFYQYRAFGVPGLGFKRGLADDIVITPHASLLALPLRPQAVMQNMDALTSAGMLGMYGFYEAADYTPGRLNLGEDMAIVKSYMSHHQGMILLSLVNHLHEDAMVRRFHSDPRIQSVEMLLMEQIPRDAPLEQSVALDSPGLRVGQPRRQVVPWHVDPYAPQPRVHYLSNGSFGTLVTAAGGGFSAWQDMQLTRWEPDETLDNTGYWIYIQDRKSHETWSSGLQPALVLNPQNEVFFSSHAAEFHHRDGSLSQLTRIFITPSDDVEIRLLSVTNHGDTPRRFRVVSYGEVVLAPHLADARHPAFNKLFIESQPLPGGDGLIFRRRPRSGDEKESFLAHTLVTGRGIETVGPPVLENDRARFLGRGRTAHNPSALENDFRPPIEDSLDPVFSISQEVVLPPHGALNLAFLTAAGRSEEGIMKQLNRYSNIEAIQTALEQALENAEVEINDLEISSSQLENFQTLLSLLFFPTPALRPNADRLAANEKGQPGLWPFSISGDYPILLVEIGDMKDLALARELLKAHTYWRRRRLMVDLVFLNLEDTSYQQELSGHFHRLLRSTESEGWLNRKGGIFFLHADHMDQADRILLETAARVVLDRSAQSLEEILENTPAVQTKQSRLPLFTPVLSADVDLPTTEPIARPQGLQYDNGLGGFTPDGQEYVIYLEPGQFPPAPWTNVIANPEFGFLTTESGLGATWSVNSGENRLSPWKNDPVSNIPREAVYLRDEETAVVWTPTPLPAPSTAAYLIRHGPGYTVYEHRSQGLNQKLTVFTPPDAPLKIIKLELENTWDRQRRITATWYSEWVLGVLREITGQYLIPEFLSDPQALLVRNPYNTEFSGRVAFAAASNPLHSMTADRTEFLGRLGSYQQPSALKRVGLTGTVRAGQDACAALQLHIDMPPGGKEQVHFIMGQAADQETALDLIRRYRSQPEVKSAWDANQRLWADTLGTVQVQTPEPAFDLLINRWLLYQNLACRYWARSAFYQSSGAYGFRDQLQDVMALLLAAPQLAREHLLRAARHQFEEGDVLHWWHPPSGRGVRTRISDDLLWLPYVTAEYVKVTGDLSVLDEKAPFLSGPLLKPDEEERYGFYQTTRSQHSLFEHCRRALEKGTTSGPHDLPLMGGGDWNDGMNRVGNEGRGESVWLGWFLYETLHRFARLCESHGQGELAADYRQRAEKITNAIEEHAWDGDWYLRAFYDDGHPLGSSKNEECQIDSIAQSWSVLSGGGNPERSGQALQSVLDRLVKPEQQLVLLFTPPFNKTRRNPGYIKGYPPGVRENGGQYTHAALWAAWSFLEAGRIEDGYRLFRIMNPIMHANTREKAEHYQVEPYVVAADVYGAAPFTGLGGWTWYTGSGGWMYRLGLEGLLGLKKTGGYLEVDPKIPGQWPGFKITCSFGSAVYEIEVQNPAHVNRGVKQVLLDGEIRTDGRIPIDGEAGRHTVKIIMG